jgi:hypothetical protein
MVMISPSELVGKMQQVQIIELYLAKFEDGTYAPFFTEEFAKRCIFRTKIVKTYAIKLPDETIILLGSIVTPR